MKNNIISIKMTVDNTQKIEDAMRKQVQAGLASWGTTAEGYAKEDATVDTGRMRNSITWAIKDKQSSANTNKHPQGQTDAKPEDYKTHATPKEGEIYIGTNVEYAPGQEYKDMTHNVGKAHFLRDAIVKHIGEYEEIMKAALKK